MYNSVLDRSINATEIVETTLRKYTRSKSNFNTNTRLALACLASTSSSKNQYAFLDSAASDNYFPASYKGELHDATARPVPVRTANNSIMHSVATDCFPMVHVPPAARACKKFVEVKLPLVSVGNL